MDDVKDAVKDGIKEVESERMAEIHEITQEQRLSNLVSKVNALEGKMREREAGEIVLAVMVCAGLVICLSAVGMIAKEVKINGTVS